MGCRASPLGDALNSTRVFFMYPMLHAHPRSSTLPPLLLCWSYCCNFTAWCYLHCLHFYGRRLLSWHCDFGPNIVLFGCQAWKQGRRATNPFYLNCRYQLSTIKFRARVSHPVSFDFGVTAATISIEIVLRASSSCYYVTE